MKGKLENLTVDEYNKDLLNPKSFDYLSNHRLQGRVVLVAPFFVKEEDEDGLIFSDEEEYMEEETFRKKTRPKVKKAVLEKGVVVKISDKVKAEMPDAGFDFKEGDIIFLNLPADAFAMMKKEYKTDRKTISFDEEEHYLLKVSLPEIESVIEN